MTPTICITIAKISKERFQSKSKGQVDSEVLDLKTKSSEMEMIGCIMSPECLKLVEQRIGWIKKENSDQIEDAALSPLRLRGGGLEMPFKIPAFFDFHKNQLPRTASGKIYKLELRKKMEKKILSLT